MHTAKMWMSSAVGMSEVSGTVNFENLNPGWPGCLGVTHPKKRVWKWPGIQPMIIELHCSVSTLWADLQFGPEGMDLPAVSGHRPLPCSVAVYHTSASQIECRAWGIQYRMWMMTMTTHKYECTPQIETGLWGDGINGFGRMPAWTNCKNNPNSC